MNLVIAEDGTIARVNKIITNPTNGNVVVGGNFSTAGSLSCEGICVLDPNSHQWNNLGGSGIGGEVLDFTFTGASDSFHRSCEKYTQS